MRLSVRSTCKGATIAALVAFPISGGCDGETAGARRNGNDASDASVSATGGARASGGSPSVTGGSPSTGGNGGAPTTGGAPSTTGGTGGRTCVYPYPDPSSITSRAQCDYSGCGGADSVYCDYVVVQFTEPLPITGFDVNVVGIGGSDGGMPTDAGPGSSGGDPRLVRDAVTGDVTGFKYTKFAAEPLYSDPPTSLSVVVKENSTTIASVTIQLDYSCVAITGDDWCWQAAPVTLPVTYP